MIPLRYCMLCFTEEEFHKRTTDSQTRWRADLLGKEMATTFWQASKRNVTVRLIGNARGLMLNSTWEPYYFQQRNHH
jgi:hypothetical protein